MMNNHPLVGRAFYTVFERSRCIVHVLENTSIKSSDVDLLSTESVAPQVAIGHDPCMYGWLATKKK